MGQEHIRNLALIPDASVSAVADSDPGMLAAAGLPVLAGRTRGVPDVVACL